MSARQIITVVGARPQFIKSSIVSREMKASGIEERIVHTGQHYDREMSRVFFEELEIPEPVVNLDVGSASQAVQTAQIMIRLEAYLMESTRPDYLLVYGDTNSTLAAALVAAKIGIPLVHVEAGLRSFNRQMPEELNRIVADRLASVLLCPTPTSVDNLHNEGISEGVHLTGDVMYDATRYFLDRALAQYPVSGRLSLREGAYAVATVHRRENIDDPERLRGILSGLGSIGCPVILPLHPGTRSRLGDLGVPDSVRVIEPVSYLEMLSLVSSARIVLTDSGGLQKESVWLGTPCITLRDETEWMETTSNGWNQLAGADPERIVAATLVEPDGPAVLPEVQDNRSGASRIAHILESQ